MRKILFLFLAVFSSCLFSCKPQSYKTMDTDIADQFRQLDTLAEMMQTLEESLQGVPKKRADSIVTAWNRVADLCCAEKPVKAYEYLHKDRNLSNVLLYLRNTTAQYYFVNEVLLPLALTALPEQDAIAEYVDNLELNFAMTRMVVILAQEENNYIPPHYLNLIADLGFSYDVMGETVKAVNMAEMMKEAFVEIGDPEIFGVLQSSAYLVQLYLNHGNVEGALGEVENAVAYVNEHPEEREELGAEDCDRLVESLRALVTNSTASLQQ